MDTLFQSGRIVDIVLAMVILEAVLLIALRGRLGHRLSVPAVLVNMGSGACLMLCLRGALTGADWPLIALPLLGSLALHVVDLTLRLRG